LGPTGSRVPDDDCERRALRLDAKCVTGPSSLVAGGLSNLIHYLFHLLFVLSPGIAVGGSVQLMASSELQWIVLWKALQDSHVDHSECRWGNERVTEDGGRKQQCASAGSARVGNNNDNNR